MRVAATLAVLVVAAAAVTAARGGSRAACPRPAPARADPGHGFELDVLGATGYVADTSGRVGSDIPGVNDDSFLPNFRPDELQQLLIGPNTTDSYIAQMVGTESWPATFALSRIHMGSGGSAVVDEVASWFVAHKVKGVPIAIAFASGQSLARVRLCVSGRPLAPTGAAAGAAARDDLPPRLSSSVAPFGPGRVRVTLHASDSRSGVAGIWYVVVRKSLTQALPYRAPVVVPRGTVLVYWGVDRAGNAGDTYVKTG